MVSFRTLTHNIFGIPLDRKKKKKKKEEIVEEGDKDATPIFKPAKTIQEKIREEEEKVKEAGVTIKKKDKKTGKKIEPKKSLGRKFTDVATNIPLGVGTSIKTIATGLSTLAGRGEEAREQLGEVTGGDIATTALTLGTAGTGGFIAGRVLRAFAPNVANFFSSGSLIRRTVDVAKARARFGLTQEQAAGLARELGRRRVSEVADVLTKSGNFLLSKKGLVTLSAVGTVTGLQYGVAWLASDNVISGASIQARDIANDLRFGNTTPEEATANLDQLQERINKGKFWVKAAIATSPLLIGTLNLWLANANGAQNSIDIARRLAERG